MARRQSVGDMVSHGAEEPLDATIEEAIETTIEDAIDVAVERAGAVERAFARSEITAGGRSPDLRAGSGPGLQPRRQREAAVERRRKMNEEAAKAAAEDMFRINWDDTEIWRTKSDDGIHEHKIHDCDDGFLWRTIIWIVRNAVPLCRQVVAVPEDQPPQLAAYLWLKNRPVFRALVREAIRRALTLPGDVYQYLKRYVLDGQQTLDGYQPWRDPQETAQASSLQALADMPLVPPELEFGRDLRSIELD